VGEIAGEEAWYSVESTAEVYRRWKRTLGLTVCISAVGTAVSFAWLVYRAEVHRHWERRVQVLILRLARKRPADVTPEYWTKCVVWTLQLHGQYGNLSYFPSAGRQPLIRDLERRLAEPVTVHTIDDVWDDYVRHAPKARPYLIYRPTANQIQNGYSTDESIESLIRRLEVLERLQK
jgi:hypothetical protein